MKKKEDYQMIIMTREIKKEKMIKRIREVLDKETDRWSKKDILILNSPKTNKKCNCDCEPCKKYDSHPHAGYCMQTQTIEEKLKELFFDYHIRGCEIASDIGNKICNENKDITIGEILALLAQEREKAVKHNEQTFTQGYKTGESVERARLNKEVEKMKKDDTHNDCPLSCNNGKLKQNGYYLLDCPYYKDVKENEIYNYVINDVLKLLGEKE